RELGVAYSRGRGIAKDPDQAQKWLQAAADGGDSEALNELRKLRPAPAKPVEVAKAKPAKAKPVAEAKPVQAAKAKPVEVSKAKPVEVAQAKPVPQRVEPPGPQPPPA